MALSFAQLYRDYVNGFKPAVANSARIVLPSQTLALPSNIDGALVVIVSAATFNVISSATFDVNNANFGTAQAAVDAMASYLNTATAMNSANLVLGVAATSSTRVRGDWCWPC